MNSLRIRDLSSDTWILINRIENLANEFDIEPDECFPLAKNALREATIWLTTKADREDAKQQEVFK